MDSREAGGGWAGLAWGKVDRGGGGGRWRLGQTGPDWARRGDPAELVFSACDAGLGRLTHMVLCSVPAPCLNPYAAGGKVPPLPPPSIPTLFQHTHPLPTLCQATREVLGGKALKACTSLLPLNPSELLSPLSLQSATPASVLRPRPSSPPLHLPPPLPLHLFISLWHPIIDELINC